MNKIYKNFLGMIFILSAIFITGSNAYESSKTKIDTHGGKSDKLINSNQKFSNNTFSLGEVSLKKSLNNKKPEEKNKNLKK